VLAGAALLGAAAGPAPAVARGVAGPTATTPPSVTGTAAAGRRLTALSGTWAGTGPLAYSYQWFRCDPLGSRCTTVRGATGPTYTLGSRDVARTVGLRVKATDESGSAVSYSSLVGPIAPAPPLLVSTARPVISGDPVQGKTVQVTTGVWSPTPQKIAYAWLRCNRNVRACSPIAGASAGTYTLSAADVGATVVARIQASFGTTTQSALSLASPPVVGANVTGPTPVAAPTVRGKAVAGAQLQGAPGTWSGVGETTFAFQWFRCDSSGAQCATIRGATSPSFRLSARDVDKTLGFRVAATDATGTTRVFASLLGPVAPANATLVSSAQPSISGDPRVGQTLTAGTGAWTEVPTAFGYAWQRCSGDGRACSAIAGATTSTYLLTSADAGRRLVVVVTATARTLSQSAYSTASAIVR
jgi:hypothetical protein